VVVERLLVLKSGESRSSNLSPFPRIPMANFTLEIHTSFFTPNKNLARILSNMTFISGLVVKPVRMKLVLLPTRLLNWMTPSVEALFNTEKFKTMNPNNS